MANYVCMRHDTADAFLARAGAWLLRNEAEHNLILSIAAQLRNSPNPNAMLVTIEHDARVVGCAFRTPPYKLGVTRMPLDAAETLAATVATIYDDTPGVLGPDAVARAVADGIAGAQGKAASERARNRIYELREVIMPARAPRGRLRLGQPADIEVLTTWLEEFARETNHGPADVVAYAQGHIAKKTLFVWDDDGPKTTALWAGSTPNGVRIGFVFTPGEYRGRGYATACVAGASRRALDKGYRFCCLYTDLANPTSNAIYQRIGYQPVCDVVDYQLSDNRSTA